MEWTSDIPLCLLYRRSVAAIVAWDQSLDRTMRLRQFERNAQHLTSCLPSVCIKIRFQMRLLCLCVGVNIWLTASGMIFRIFNGSSYSYTCDVTIPQGEIYTFELVNSLAINGVLHIEGSLIAHLNHEGFVRFQKQFTLEKSTSIITGEDNFQVILDASIGISQDSIFRLDSRNTLSVIMTSLEPRFRNEGQFSTIALDTLHFRALRNIINSGSILCRAESSVRLHFEEIHNDHLFDVRSRAKHSDHVSFGNVVNFGTFSISLGSGLALGFESRGTITNTGVINFFSRTGIKRFFQADEVLNFGLICLRRVSFYQTNITRGNGCWRLLTLASIHLDMRDNFDRSSSIVLDATTAYVSISRFYASDIPIELYGIQTSRAFLRSPLHVSQVQYDPGSGFLKVYEDSETYMVLSIGLGYENHLFEVFRDRVRYTGTTPDPRPIPPECLIASLMETVHIL